MIWVEIIGFGTENKGGEMMTIAIQQQLTKEFPQIRFVVAPTSNYSERIKYGFYQKVWFQKKGRQLGLFIGKIIPLKIRKAFGLIKDEEIDIILDASGFAYSDQWGVAALQNRMTKHIARWKKQGKLIILLPQAFGPFDNNEFETPIRKLIKYADLLYARDEYSHLTLERFSNKTPVSQAPDFTNLLHGKLPEKHNPDKHQICFIPNYRMIDKKAIDENKYIQQVGNSIKQCLESGRKPFLLVHEGLDDELLAKKIIEYSSTDIPLLKNNDPLILKGIIGSSQIVLSSRYHGLVSALSQGVPVVATGWSHKYRALLNDYGCSNYLVDMNNNNELLLRLERLLDHNEYDVVKENILVNAVKQKKLAESMWLEVKTAIRDKLNQKMKMKDNNL